MTAAPCGLGGVARAAAHIASDSRVALGGTSLEAEART
jgi:hypothetical protein